MHVTILRTFGLRNVFVAGWIGLARVRFVDRAVASMSAQAAITVNDRPALLSLTTSDLSGRTEELPGEPDAEPDNVDVALHDGTSIRLDHSFGPSGTRSL